MYLHTGYSCSQRPPFVEHDISALQKSLSCVMGMGYMCEEGNLVLACPCACTSRPIAGGRYEEIQFHLHLPSSIYDGAVTPLE